MIRFFLILCCFNMFSSVYAATEGHAKLDKLFMLPEERLEIAQQRQAYLKKQAQNPEQVSTVKLEVKPTKRKIKLPRYIKVSGLILSDAGYYLARINAQYIQIHQSIMDARLIAVNEAHQTVTLNIAGKKIIIPVGFAYITATKKMIRLYELARLNHKMNRPLHSASQTSPTPSQNNPLSNQANPLKSLSNLLKHSGS